MGIVYLILALGAVTTLYPFLIMVSTGLKGSLDQNDNKLIPEYLKDDVALRAKYIDDKYAGDAPAIASTRIGIDAPSELVAKYEKFLMELPVDQWTVGFRPAANGVTSRLMARYQTWLRERFGRVDNLNKAYIEENVAFQTVQPPTELLTMKRWKPAAGKKYEDWRIFKATLPAEFRIPVRLDRIWQEFWRAEAKNQLTAVPAEVVGPAKTFEELKIGLLGQGFAPPQWERFRDTRLPDRYLSDNPDIRWARLDAIAANMMPGAFGAKVTPMPIAAHEAKEVASRKSEMRGEFAGRNYRYVLDYILINGRAVTNTAIFCGLAILTQLLVNPLAAYALSRYPVKASGQILIFLLATMAFPAEVAMIPSFLLLKDLGLLNTFAALVLPTAASGYMIFLLKGFFDSLPQELFEAGQLDGAKETTMMMRVALPLSRPVLGFLALTAFMSSYGAFLYAFLVAQDQRMWTLMVWVYQLQTTAPKAVTMAALALVALPTLLVFLLAQRVIMRGIVLPGER